MTAADEKRGFWAKCRACAHCWIAAYLPMEMAACARLMGLAACPLCGDRKPLIAKQEYGVLLGQDAGDQTGGFS